MSWRFHGDNGCDGQTAWIYNSPKRALAKIELSVRASDGYAWSVVEGITEDGFAYGTYRKFAEDGSDLGYRGFIWVTGQGARDAGEALTVDPSDVGWDRFTSASAGGWNIVVGYGRPLGSPAEGIYKTTIHAPPVIY